MYYYSSSYIVLKTMNMFMHAVMRLLLGMITWSFYNKSLERGEVILDFDVIDSWYSELDRMNDGKRGAQYHYPYSFIQLLGYMKLYFHLPYRQAEGVVIAHAGTKIPSIPNYSTINRRVNTHDIRISELHEFITFYVEVNRNHLYALAPSTFCSYLY